MASSGNFCTLNPLHAQGGGTSDFGTLSNGSLSVSLTDTAFGNFGVTSGKWYWEYRMVSSATSGSAIGWANERVNSQPELGYNSPSSSSGAQIVYVYLDNNPMQIISDAPKSSSSGGNLSANAISQNDIIGVAADFDNDKWYFSINGSFTDMLSGQNPSDGSNPTCSASGGGGVVTIARTAGFTWFPAIGSWAAPTRDYTVNFGQDSTFGGAITAGGESDGNGFGDFKYSVPTGFLAMCSANLPISDDIDPAQTDDDYPGKQFDAVAYAGNSSSNAIDTLNFQPDFCWIKNRTSTDSYSNALIDSSRGRSKVSYSSSARAELTSASDKDLVSFDSGGFTLGANEQTGANYSGKDYIAWAWKAAAGTTASNTEGGVNSTTQANTKSGFSIVTYTGIAGASGSSTVGHGLSKTPEFIIHVSRSRAAGRWVQHVGTTSSNYVLQMASAAQTDYSSYGTISSPTTTTFGINGIDGIGGESANYVAYVWHSVEGFSRFGKYEGNGNVDGPFVYTGFRPRMIALKDLDRAENWQTFDSARNTFNTVDKGAIWNSTGAESTGSGSGFDVDFLSNGFKLRCTHDNVNGSSTYVYCAWGDIPFKYNNTF